MNKAQLIASLANVPDDEPLFCLRAQDRCAASTVRVWAACAASMSAPPQKVHEAIVCSEAMDKWETKKVPD